MAYVIAMPLQFQTHRQLIRIVVTGIDARLTHKERLVEMNQDWAEVWAHRAEWQESYVG